MAKDEGVRGRHERNGTVRVIANEGTDGHGWKRLEGWEFTEWRWWHRGSLVLTRCSITR